MTSFLGIWDAEDYRTDQAFDLSQMQPQQVAIVSVLGCGALAERNGHGKKRKKFHLTRKYFSPP